LPNDDDGLGGVSDPATKQKALTTNPVDALGLAQKLPKKTLLFLHNFQMFLASEAVQQSFWNGRDTNKANLRCWIALGPAFDNPPTIAQDVVVLDEPPPSSAALESIVVGNIDAYNKNQKAKGQPTIPTLEPEVRARAADALLGMPAFAADQACAVNTTVKGLNVAGLWTAKISKIGSIRGMSVHRGLEQIANYVGYEYAVDLMIRLVSSKRLNIKGLWLWDEIDKDFAGNAGDNTGVSQEMHGKLLKLINNLEIPCLLFGGVWGTGKTELVKCARNSAPGGEIAMLETSLAEMKSGVVGSSMISLMTAIKTGMAITGGKPLMIFTANSLKPLSPEFRSRMLVQLFFEQQSDENVAKLWATYMRKYDLPKQAIPDSSGWVGREVKNCCKMAYDLEIPLLTAARGVVPQTVSSRAKLIEMRREANGSLTDATNGGLYKWQDDPGPDLGEERRRRAFDN
ncbi:MAG TPA: hypothetical protein VLA89_13450, partial [Gemmatimonadales bacterium]|nr:hypothetical protein [Gemmatimonadales bacterium]